MRRYKAKGVKTRCYQEGLGQFEPRFPGEAVVPGEYFFGFYKTRHILLSDNANCTVLRAVVLTQYRRATDGQTDIQTDGITIASTVLAMRALRRRAVIKLYYRVSVCDSWLSVGGPRSPVPRRFIIGRQCSNGGQKSRTARTIMGGLQS